MELRKFPDGSSATVKTNAGPRGAQLALVVITSLFFMFGFLTCMNDILVPHLKSLFTLNYTQAILVQFCFFASYFLMSIPAARFCEAFGYKRGMVTGLGITGLGTLGFILSAAMVSFPMFLAAFFVLATGITLLQVAANPYVTMLGDPATGSSRLNLVQAFNSLGTTVAPLIGSSVILANTASGADAVKTPYWIITGILVVLAAGIALYPFPSYSDAGAAEKGTTYRELMRDSRLMLGALGIFAYVGSEVAIGSFLINWLGDASVRGFSHEQAGRYVAFYWGGAMVGRFLGTPLLAKYNPARVLSFFVIGALAGVLTTISTHGEVAQWSILAVGLMNSIMFPTIFSQSLGHLKKGVAKASGLLCTAIVGGAILPLFQGVVADHLGLRASFVVPALGYTYLLGMSVLFARPSRKVVHTEAAANAQAVLT